MRIRFHLDEHVPAGICAGLRRRGIDVTTCQDSKLSGATDEEQLRFSIENGRVLVTQDDDFLRLHERAASHCGIVYCAQGTRTLGEMLRVLILIHDVLTSEEMCGHVEFM